VVDRSAAGFSARLIGKESMDSLRRGSAGEFASSPARRGPFNFEPQPLQAANKALIGKSVRLL
jgi:hypothetical protein